MAKKKTQGAKAKPTQRQDQAFDRLVEGMLKGETTESTVSLRVAYARGEHAAKALKDKPMFGPRSIDEIAGRLGVQRLTLNKCIKFRTHITKAQLAEVCNPKGKPDGWRPPPWRTMMKWADIKDDQRREKMLKSITSGDLASSTEIDLELRKVLEMGPKKTRRPASPQATFNKISNRATSLCTELHEWIPRASVGLRGIKDTVQRRDAKKIVQDSIKGLKELQKQVTDAIAKCQELVK